MDSDSSGESSPKVVFPKTVAPIMALAGGLAMFLVIAPLLLISHPIGSTISRYFYGIDLTEKIDLFDTRNNTKTSESCMTNINGNSNETSSGLVFERGTKQSIDGGKNDETVSSKTAASGLLNNINVQKSNRTEANIANSGCDLYQGKWIYDSTGLLYASDSCPVLSQMHNCQSNGRPDKEYQNWRWKPEQCDLPLFDAERFFEIDERKDFSFYW